MILTVLLDSIMLFIFFVNRDKIRAERIFIRFVFWNKEQILNIKFTVR